MNIVKFDRDMIAEDRKQLREFLCKEYKLKTGIGLRCIEQTGIRPSRAKVACRMNIVRIASEYTEVPVDQIMSRSRKRDLVDIRRMIIAVMRIHKIIYEEIAMVIGGHDHSNIVTALQVHKDYCRSDKEYRERYREFLDYCKQEILRVHQENKPVRITPEMIQEIQQWYATDTPEMSRMAQVYNIHPDTVSKIVNGRYKSAVTNQ
jgi:Bacterial dnaA protein helix-turn-helix